MTAQDFDGQWLTGRTLALLALSADFDAHRDEIAAVVWQVAARYGDRGTFSVACSLAACLTHMAVHPTVAGLDADGEQDVAAAAAFLAAHTDGDFRACLDLFHAMAGQVFAGLCLLAGAAYAHPGALR